VKEDDAYCDVCVRESKVSRIRRQPSQSGSSTFNSIYGSPPLTRCGQTRKAKKTGSNNRLPLSFRAPRRSSRPCALPESRPYVPRFPRSYLPRRTSPETSDTGVPNRGSRAAPSHSPVVSREFSCCRFSRVAAVKSVVAGHGGVQHWEGSTNRCFLLLRKLPTPMVGAATLAIAFLALSRQQRRWD